MNGKNAFLVEPSAELKAEFLVMAEEFQAEGDERFKDALEDFPAYLEHLKKFASGKNLPPGRVQANSFWLVGNNQIFGQSSLRHHLNLELEHEGGHIGYAIRPTERRKGYGTLILNLTLEKAKNLGLNRVLVTCDTDNIGSAKIIEKNGGKLAGRAISNRTGKPISRYWIEIS